jgi:hypothetical protein
MPTSLCQFTQAQVVSQQEDLCYLNATQQVGRDDKRNHGGHSQQTAPAACPSCDFDEAQFPFVGIDALREIRELSILFADPNDPFEWVLYGSTAIRERRGGEKPIFPPARDPLALSLDWEYPELLDESRALCSQSRLFGGPGIGGYQDSCRFFVGARPAFAEPKLPRIIRAPNFGEWHAELLDSLNDRLLFGVGVQAGADSPGIIKPYHSILLELMRQMDSDSVGMHKARTGALREFLVLVRETTAGSLLYGTGVNSDAGLTGSLVINERNFDLAHSGATQPDDRSETIPGPGTSQRSVNFTATPIEDKPLYFHFGLEFFRAR